MKLAEAMFAWTPADSAEMAAAGNAVVGQHRDRNGGSRHYIFCFEV